MNYSLYFILLLFRRHLCQLDSFVPSSSSSGQSGTNSGTIGSGRVGDTCAFNTDCLSGMFCMQGNCRCVGSHVPVDSYCFPKVNPAESGCHYDAQCAAVWPASYCRSGICHCPSGDMIAVKTKDGVVCVWAVSSEPSCPLPSLPPPGSPSSLLALPGPSINGSLPIAVCNPFGPPIDTNEDLEEYPERFSCGVLNLDGVAQDVSDIYDCIDNSKFWAAHGRESFDPVGVCCMSRALTCMQPRRGESSASEAEARWWYNSIAGGCEAFLFDATLNDISANNFATQAHCESYCQDACARGPPAHQAEKTPRVACSATSPCPDNFECNHVGTTTTCCPSAKWICSSEGGRVGHLLPSVYDPGLRYEHLAGVKSQKGYATPTTRFYFNTVESRCESFEYFGYIGNFNNFQTMSDCQSYCAKLQCPFGIPLDGGGGRPQKCGSESGCPSSHHCTDDNVCCPTAQTVCAQPLRNGECKQAIRAFWYDAHSLTCRSFTYTGCQGNENRFSSLEECHRICDGIRPEPRCAQGKALVDQSTGRYVVCSLNGESASCPASYECTFDGQTHGCCSTKSQTCSLRPDKGTHCRVGSSYRFFYNREIKECESFLYNGCDGNSNNFVTAEECETYCELTMCPNGGRAARAGGRALSCINDSCPRGHECVLVDATHSRCCPTRESICSEPPIFGGPHKCTRTTHNTKQKWYFNPSQQSCSEYPVGACESNNVFDTEEECTFFCLAAGCPSGDILFREDGTSRPLQCDTLRVCPMHAECLENTLTGTSFCCGSDGMGVCPHGEKAFVDARTRSARQCDLATDRTCPGGTKCRFSQTDGRYYCCAPVTHGIFTPNLCPSGRALFRFPDGMPLQCPLIPTNSCPPGYACLSHMDNSKNGQCCSDKPICPEGEKFHTDPKTGLPTLCTRDAFSICPSGYHCRANGERLFCCEARERPAKNEGCPPDQFANLVGGKAQVCDPFGTPCAAGYTCQWSLSNNRYQCCGHGAAETQRNSTQDTSGCALRHFALIEDGQVRMCSPTAPCPLGFSCQFIPKQSRYQCCAQSAGCPKGRASFLSVGGNALECDKSKPCPKGYECVPSTESKGTHICCSPDYAAPPGKPGTKCATECTGGARCVDHKCICSPGMTILSEKCVKECTAKELRHGDECLPKHAPGHPCKIQEQCQHGSSCSAGKCQCPTKHIQVNEKCMSVADICGPAARVLLSSGLPRVCSETRPCPTQYNCIKSNPLDKNVCCGRLPGSREVCPVGMSAHRRKGKPTPCSSASCPDGFLCKFSTTRKKYYCCGRTKHGGCGLRALKKRDGTKMECGDKNGRCPRGYTCTAYPNGYECCPDDVEAESGEEEEESGEEEEEEEGEEESTEGEEEEEETRLQHHPVVCPRYLRRRIVVVDGHERIVCVRCVGEECSGMRIANSDHSRSSLFQLSHLT